jgi:flagellar motor protein MotB
MDRYEAILELYEAQNAIGIARAANAEQYAPQTFAKAQQLYDTAKNLESGRASSKLTVQDAREAVQTAEDARMIAERSREEETLVSARTEAAHSQRALARAEQEAQRAQSEADAARIRADAEHVARERAEAEAARAQAARADASARVVPVQPQITIVQPRPDTRKSDLRMGLLEQLNGVIAVRDTSRGLVAALPNSAFEGSRLQAAVSSRLARIAAVVLAHPGLRIDVEGNTDSSATEVLSSQRAEAVRRGLIAQSLPASSVTARGLGDTHPFGPNSSAAGREANRRVEIVISGDPIGDMAFWDHRYTLTPDR